MIKIGNETETRPIVLECRGLTKQFNGFYALRDVDFRLEKGTVHALIGPNGAGKTTLFNLLTRFLEPTSGKILHEGSDVTRQRPARMARRGLVRSFQICAAFFSLTVQENIKIALLRRHRLHHRLLSSFSALPQLAETTERLLAEFGLASDAERIVGTLSYGRKRILELAVTVALDPMTILLDEPTSGLGGEDIGRVTDMIAEIGKRRTLLIVEHNLSVVSQVAHAVTVMVRGQILAQGTYQQVADREDVMSAYMGRGHG